MPSTRGLESCALRCGLAGNLHDSCCLGPPFSPTSGFCLSETNDCRRAVWTGLSGAEQAHPCLPSQRHLNPLEIVRGERVQLLKDPQRGLSGSIAMSDGRPWQDSVPGLELWESAGAPRWRGQMASVETRYFSPTALRVGPELSTCVCSCAKYHCHRS